MQNSAWDYDAWYQTKRGVWMGELEYKHIKQLLGVAPGGQILDVGCGTGFFTRHLASDGYRMTGVDNNVEMLEVARAQRVGDERYLHADALSLPFADREFDCSIAITSLCFIENQARALAEMRRVTKRRVVLGVLNRHSLHYLQKGRHGGKGHYRGAHWHDLPELHELFAAASMSVTQASSAVFCTSAGGLAKMVEYVIPNRFPLGALLFASADVDSQIR